MNFSISVIVVAVFAMIAGIAATVKPCDVHMMTTDWDQVFGFSDGRGIYIDFMESRLHNVYFLDRRIKK